MHPDLGKLKTHILGRIIEANMKTPIYLTGFMGSGKSTLGRLLASSLGLNFIDLDHFIKDTEKATIPELFEKLGESGFREVENRAIHQTSNMTNTVIATGGGAPCFFNNMAVMNQNGTTVYLQLSPESLVKRLLPGREHRPLIAGKSEPELLKFIRIKLKERTPFYEKSNIIADTNNLTPEDTVSAIIKVIERTDQ
jgi:shikimate kinase